MPNHNGRNPARPKKKEDKKKKALKKKKNVTGKTAPKTKPKK